MLTLSCSQKYDFSRSHVWIWDLDHKEGWALKSWCFQTVVLKKTLESPQTARRWNQSILKEINLDYLLEGLKPIWPADAKGWPIGKDPDAGKDWGQEEKVATEDETVGWRHWLNGLESEQTLGGCEGQGSLECCGPWGRRVRRDLANEHQQQQQQKQKTSNWF